MTTHHTERITCPVCHGTTEEPSEPWRPCTYCMGIGAVHVTKYPTPDVAPHQFEDDPPGRDLEP